MSDSSSSNTRSGSGEREAESLAAVNITVLCTSSVFIVYSLVQLLRIHVRARRLTAQQQSRARASAAAGVTTLAAAPVRFVGKALFHVFVFASMACKAAAVATEIFGPCGEATRWPAAPRVCWPLTEALYRVQNVLLFLAYLDTCLAWSEYLDGASALLYGARTRRPAAAAAARRHRALLAAGAVLLAAATAAYVALLFVLHRADPADPDRAATTLDLASVTAVGVLYLASAVWIAVQCARFIGLTRRARRATATATRPRCCCTAAYGTADGMTAGGSAAAAAAAAAGAAGSDGAGGIGGISGGGISNNSGMDEDRDGAGGAGDGAAGGAGAPGTADARRSQRRQLGAMFALIIVCSVLLLVRAVWPVVAWLFTTETIGYSDWYNLGEHLLCEVVPLVCMCTLVFPLPRASVVRGYNGGTGIIVGTSVSVAPARTAAANSAAAASATIVVPVSSSTGSSSSGAESNAQRTRHGSVNSVYECVSEDDDDERRGLLQHQSGARR